MSLADCCDSITCWYDDAADECDPPDRCAACGADELCVQRYGGVCDAPHPVQCVPRTVDCPQNACTPACEAAYCPSPYQCQTRPACGDEAPGAFTCYGP